MFTRPHDTYESLQEVRDALGETTVREIVEGLPESVREQQRQENPFNPHTQTAKHDAFADGWYAGYSLHFAASMAYGGSVTKAARNPDELIDALRQARRGVDDLSVGLRSGSKTGMVKQVAADGGRVTDDLVSGLSSAQAAQKVRELVDDIPPGKYDDLSRSHEQLGTFLNRHGEDGVTVINRLDSGDAHQLLSASPDDELVTTIVRTTNDHAVDPNALMRVAERGQDVRHVEKTLNNKATGRWSPGGPGDSAANFNRHHSDHASEWSPTLSKDEYRTKATNLANQDSNVELYYQFDKQNMAVYDRASNELVTKNANGEIQTYFKPRPPREYVDDRVDADQAIRMDLG